MKIHKVTNIEQFVAKIIPKQAQKNKTIVETIIKNVQKNGDSSVKKYEKKFAGATISNLRVSKSEIKNAYTKVSKNEITALKLSKNKVEKTESVIKNIFKDKKIMGWKNREKIRKNCNGRYYLYVEIASSCGRQNTRSINRTI